MKVEPIPQKTHREILSQARVAVDDLVLHRNKRSISINLKMETGRCFFIRWSKRLMWSLRIFLDVKYRLNVDYESCRR